MYTHIGDTNTIQRHVHDEANGIYGVRSSALLLVYLTGFTNRFKGIWSLLWALRMSNSIEQQHNIFLTATKKEKGIHFISCYSCFYFTIRWNETSKPNKIWNCVPFVRFRFCMASEDWVNNNFFSPCICMWREFFVVWLSPNTDGMLVSLFLRTKILNFKWPRTMKNF